MPQIETSLCVSATGAANTWSIAKLQSTSKYSAQIYHKYELI